MKKPLDIDTPKTKRCNTWQQLKEEGTVVDGVLYLPIGITTGTIPIQDTKSYKQEEINKLSKQYSSVNIEKYINHEDRNSKLSYNPEDNSDES